MKKRILSILLTACLILSLIPMTAFADGTPTEVQEEQLPLENEEEVNEPEEQLPLENEEEENEPEEQPQENPETAPLEVTSEESEEEEPESETDLLLASPLLTQQGGQKEPCTKVTVTSTASEDDDYTSLVNISVPASYANGETGFIIADFTSLFKTGTTLENIDTYINNERDEQDYYDFIKDEFSSFCILSDDNVEDVTWVENETDDGFHMEEPFEYAPIGYSAFYLIPAGAGSSDDFVLLCDDFDVKCLEICPELSFVLNVDDPLDAGMTLTDKYGSYSVVFYTYNYKELAAGKAVNGEYYHYCIVPELDSKYVIDEMYCNGYEMDYDEEYGYYSYDNALLPKEPAIDLVKMLLSDKNMKVSNVKVQGTACSFNTEKLGIEKGLLLDTSGTYPQEWTDTDLEKLLDYPYGGDTASLEFDMVANGNLLLFDYVFASYEFKEQPKYNDMFALFVSTSKDGVNYSKPENIALFTDSDGEEHTVSMNSLRNAYGKLVAGMDNPANYTNHTVTDKEINPYFSYENDFGQTYTFTARKEVNIGDYVRLKFVICDISDHYYNSYVAIKADSIAFIDAKSNYLEKKIYDLEPSETYTFKQNGKTYTVSASEDGIIPFAGKDDNGKDYNFRGGNVLITRVANGQSGILEVAAPQQAKVAPKKISPDTVTLPATTAVNYAIVPEGSELTAAELKEEYENFMAGNTAALKLTWVCADENSEVSFTGLMPVSRYTIYSIIPATVEAPESEGIGSKTVQTLSVPVAGSVQDITDSGNNFGDAGWSLTEEELEDIFIIEQDEKAEGVNLWLEVNDSTDTVSFASMDKIETAASKLSGTSEVLQYLDISIYRQIGSAEAEKVQPESPVTINVTVPEELRRNGGNYQVVCLHNGAVRTINPNGYDSETGILTFIADKFSDYALVYTMPVDLKKHQTGSDGFSGNTDAAYGSWLLTADGWRYLYSDGTDIKNRWAYLYNPYATGTQEKSSWFHFNESGIMETGWFTDLDGQIYYLNPVIDNTLGQMFHGDCVIDGKTYHFNEQGEGTYGALAK